MIIQDADQPRRRRTILGIALALSLLTLAGLGLALQPEPSPYSSLPEEALYCGAEGVRGGKFTSNGHRFNGGSARSDPCARHGRYSSRLPGSGETEYGIGYQQEQPRPGRAWRASVWRKKNGRTDSYLAARVDGEQPMYWQENISVLTDSLGWEKLELRFFVPFGSRNDRWAVYVYSNGHAPVCFDDLLIEQLPDTAGFQPERIELQISERSMRQLEAKREEALAKGILETDGSDWVPARFSSDSLEEVAAEVRLKGDWLDHLSGRKWSFRVKMAQGSWRRMRVFSLHTPKARHFLHEWLLHQLWESEDVLTTRYDFVELFLNGESLGLYAFEEHFEKQLVESRARREGPILKFSEDGYWKTIERQLNEQGYIRPGAAYRTTEPRNAPIEAFDEPDPELRPQLVAALQQARQLMQQYREGERPVAEVFDLPRLARFYALCDVLNAYHGIVWHNQRFYYNPITDKLEPVGFDGFGGPPERQYALLGTGALHPDRQLTDQLYRQLFQDEQFTNTYLKELYRLSSRDWLGPKMDSLSAGFLGRLQWIQREFPGYEARPDDFLRDAAYVHSLLLPLGRYSLVAYTEQARGPAKQLLVGNRHQLPLRILGYGRSKNRMSAGLQAPRILPAQPEREYLMRLRRDSRDLECGFPEHQAMRKQLPPSFYEIEVGAAATHLFYKVPGIDSLFATPILPYAAPGQRTDFQQLRRQASPSNNQSYRLLDKQVVFPAGTHTLTEDLVVPEGYELRLQPGADIRLANGASILSFGPLFALGTQDEPVKISGQNGQGGGIAIIQAGAPSRMNYVLLQGLSNPKSGGWQLTGALTFYESEIEMQNCAIINNRSEDGLNTIRTRFRLSDCFFSRAASDAFDSDFCKGTIRDCRFENSGNDGLDVSGSTVTAERCTFLNNGDKAVSVGEESDLTLLESSITGAVIATASKDYSVLRVRGLRLKDCQQGFVAFQKKPEFGPATIIVESYTAEGVSRLHQSAEDSRILLPSVQ